MFFGSLAKGTYTAYSDADILIVSDELPRNPLDRIVMFLDSSIPIDLEVRAYTTKEILNLARSKSKFMKEIVETAIILAGDKTILQKIKHVIRE